MSSCARRSVRVAPNPYPAQSARPTASRLVDDRRRAALEVYESQEVPTWRRSGFWTTSLRGLDLDALEPKRYETLDSGVVREDRKSTRLNSSHTVISYAVFCL